MKIEIRRCSVDPDPDRAVMIEDFAEKHDLTLVVGERSARDATYRFYAHFSHVDVMSEGLLTSAHGNGHDVQAAIESYAAQIHGTRIAVEAYTPRRREIDVPNNLRVRDTYK